MPISKIKTSSITADAASINLNIDANTLFLDVANNRVGVNNITPAVSLDVTGAVRASSKFSIAGNGAAPTATALDIGTNGVGSRFVYNAPTGGEHDFSINGVNAAYIAAASVGGFTSASTVAWSLSNNTAGALTLDSSGNVGINNTSPSTFGKVTIQVAGTTTPTNATNVGPSSINLYNGGSGGATGSTVGIFGWQAVNPGIGSGIGFTRESDSNWGSQIRFYTHSPDVANIDNITERMRIDSTGSLRIGNTGSGGTGPNGVGKFILNSDGYNMFMGGRFIGGDNSSTYFTIGNWGDTSSEMRISTRGFTSFLTGSTSESNGTERMRIDSSGNLLVGTTSAVDSSKMQVVGAKAFSSGIPQGQLNVADSTAYAAGVGGAISFGGKYHSAGFYTTYASIEGVKENSTDGHYSGNLVVRVRSNGGDNVERMRIGALDNSIRLYSGTNGYSPPLCFGHETDVSKKAIFLDNFWLVVQGHNNEGIRFQTTNGAGTITTRMTIGGGGAVSIPGSLSKGSGSFRIEHPLPEKSETHELVHSFIEGPQADLIYRGKVNLVAGTATVNIDTASGMTEGTFEVLCRDVQCFTTNESDWTAVRGSVTGNILTIEAQDNTSTASISWMVIGERKDKHMYDTGWTDDDGKVIVEPLKVEPEEIAPTETE